MADSASNLAQRFKPISEFVRGIFRAINGQPAEDEKYPYFVDEDDIRERSRGDVYELDARSYEWLLAHYGGGEWQIMHDDAEIESHFWISKDGLQRAEAIAMQRAKNPEPPQVSVINPVAPTEQLKHDEKKDKEKK